MAFSGCGALSGKIERWRWSWDREEEGIWMGGIGGSVWDLVCPLLPVAGRGRYLIEVVQWSRLHGES